MNALTILAFVCMAACAKASVGPHGGAVVSGPSGVVTNHGAIGPAGHDSGLAHGGFGYGYGLHGTAPVASALVVGPAHGLGYNVLGYGHGLGYGLGYGYGHDDVLAVGHHGVTVQGPPTVPVVVAGPSGQIVADGLWGPTSHWAYGSPGVHGW